MGLAASQGRYLCLTARMSDLVYEAQQISQQRLALASETSDIATEYSEKLNNRILQATFVDDSGASVTQQLTYEILTSQDPFSGLCMRIVDLNGNVVVPGKESCVSVDEQDEDGNDVTSYYSASEFLNKYLSDDENAAEMSTWTVSELSAYYNENYSESSGVTTSTSTSSYSYLKNDDEKYLYDENCTDPSYLQEMLESGEWLIQQLETDSEWEDIVWQGSSSISSVLDTSDDAAAEAEYEEATARLQKEDKTLELRLEQIQTEESSVETEMDSVKEIISKNIEESFGTFA
ncbi:MAG: hypothetical protein LUG16_02330 [Candidatus Gastranaerophilales bacterium]|nr:hypothetical protein [Candidatus Gastranaerophilales bacterium]